MADWETMGKTPLPEENVNPAWVTPSRETPR